MSAPANSSNTTDEMPEEIRLLMNITVILGAVLMVVGILGNLLVLWTVIRCPSLHIPMYVTVASLAVSDTCTLIVAPTMYFIHVQLTSVNFNKITCDMSEVLPRTFPLASSLHIMLISLGRYVAVRYPLHARSYLTNQRTLVTIAGIYIFSFLVHFYLFTMMKFNEATLECQQDFRDKTWQIWYGLVLNIIRAILPLIVLIFLNLSIAQVLIEKTRLRHKMTETPTKKEKAMTAANTSALTMMAVVITCFLLLNWPICIMMVVLFALPKVHVDMVQPSMHTIYVCMTVSKIFLYLNSMANPIIYTAVSANFRSKLMKAFRKFGEPETSFVSTTDRSPLSERSTSAAMTPRKTGSSLVGAQRRLVQKDGRNTLPGPSLCSLDSRPSRGALPFTPSSIKSRPSRDIHHHLASHQSSAFIPTSSSYLHATHSRSNARRDMPYSAIRSSNSSDGKTSYMAQREFSSKPDLRAKSSGLHSSVVQKGQSGTSVSHVYAHSTSTPHVYIQYPNALYPEHTTPRAYSQNTFPPHIHDETTTPQTYAQNSTTRHVYTEHSTESQDHSSPRQSEEWNETRV